MQPFIVVGDKTSHGGTVVGSTATTVTTHNRPIARVGDKVTCPKCGENTIATGDPTMIVMGQPAARQGDKTACGATLISSQSVTLSGASNGGIGSFFANTERPSSTSPSNQAKQTYDRVFLLKNNQTGQPIPYAAYRITLPDGNKIEGTTDAHGMTQRIVATDKREVKIEVYV